jgi:2-desacetyl-2-hydroxyethyl bacteriochlorophyllide A dehydrogenase
MVTGTAVNRRIVVNGLHDVVVEMVTEPVPVAGEARVRTTVVGICGSDLHAASGHHPFIDLPYRPGHEAVGVVDAVGPGVDESNICRELQVFGCQTPGALADSFTIAEDRMVRLADDLDDRHAVLIEPLATPVHAVRRASETVGDLFDRPVVVIGAGPIGLFALLAARHVGAKVIVADLLESKRARAERLGAAGTFDPTAPDAIAAARRLLGGPAAVVIDCVARESSVAQAVELVDKGGAIMIVGVAAGATPVPLDLIQDRELTLIGSLMYVREDFIAALDMLASGAVPVDEIISAEFDLEHSAEAFAASADAENVKVLVTVGSDPGRSR